MRCTVISAALYALASFAVSGAAQTTTQTTIGQAPRTTIGPNAIPRVPGVPEWVYNSRVPPQLRQRFEVLYQMLNQRLGSQPQTVAENFQKLAAELGDIGASGAVGVSPGVPDFIWQLDYPAQTRWLQDRIQENVKDYHLEDIALSEDLVPSLRPAKPTRSKSDGARQFTPDEATKLLTPAAKEAATPVETAHPPKFCDAEAKNCKKGCDALDSLRDANVCFEECSIAQDRCLNKPVAQSRLDYVAAMKGLKACLKQLTAQQAACGTNPPFSGPAWEAWKRCMDAANAAHESCMASLPKPH